MNNLNKRKVPYNIDVMKATLTFDLPEEREEFELATRAAAFMLVLHDFDQHLRSQMKYNDQLSAEQFKIYDDLRSKLHEFASDNNVEI